MPTGHVDYIKIGSDFCFVNLKEAGWFILWWTGEVTGPLSAFDSIKNSMWVSLLREALVNSLEVELFTEDSYSSVVLTVKLKASGP